MACVIVCEEKRTRTTLRATYDLRAIVSVGKIFIPESLGLCIYDYHTEADYYKINRR